MPFNINQFIGSIGSAGVLQGNKFEVEIGVPNALRNVYPPNQLLTFRADSVNIPGVTIDAIETRRYGIGPRQKMATNVAMQDINITFIETKESTFQKFFYLWSNLIFDFSGRRNSGGNGAPPAYTATYQSEYVTPIKIKVFNNEGTSQGTSEIRPVAIIGLDEAFPITLSDNSLNWNNQNSLYRVSVSFAYTTWYIENV